MSERKEKKKKDKVTDILKHTETQSKIVKGGRKKHETDDPETLVGPGTVSCNPTAEEKRKKIKRDRKDEKPPSADKKKRKKDKIFEATSGPASIVSAPDSSLEATGTVATTSAVTEKGMRRKSKSSAEAFDPHTSATRPAPTANFTGEPEKARKQELAKGDAVNVKVEADRLSRSNSKLKKRKKEIETDDEDHHSAAVLTEGHSSRKRKKSKHPDPTDDPDLTEQSQKCSYPYSKSLTILTSLFDRRSSDLRLFPIYLTRNLEIQQSPPKLGDPQHLDVQGTGTVFRDSPTSSDPPPTLLGPGKIFPDGCRILVQGSGASKRGKRQKTAEQNRLTMSCLLVRPSSNLAKQSFRTPT